MVFNLRRIFQKATAISEPNIASDEDLPFFEKSEESKDVLGYGPPPPSKYWIKRKKLQFGVKVLFLTSAFAFTLFFGRAIFNYATSGYHAMLRSIEAHGFVACSHNVTVNEPIYIAAPPWKGPPVGAFEIKDRSKWVAECSNSSDALHDCKYAIAGGDSYWQSPDTAPSSGHWILIDLNQTYNVHSVAVRPYENWKKQGGAVQKHRVEVATVKGNWELVALGAWRGDTGDQKYATFEPCRAQFVRLTAVDSTENKKFVAIGDLNIHAVETIPASVDKKKLGEWGITLDFPLVPVTAFLNPITKHLITMSADQADRFANPGPNQRLTFSATWDPEQGIIEQKILRDSQHAIFCPGTSFDESGRVIVTGGSTPKGVSIYEPNNNTWSNKDKAGNVLQLKIARGYQGQTYLPNGKTFLIGGTWSGGTTAEAGYRDGELYDPETGWTILKNVKANLTQMDAVISKLPVCNPPSPDEKCTMMEWQQHHSWLFAWKGDSIFHAGPSKKMNWIFPKPPDGELKDGGNRSDGTFADGDAVCGITSMYDAEKGIILTAGGAPNYHYWFRGERTGATDPHREESTNNAFEITLGNPGTVLQPKRVESMKYPRIFANAVILPTGETLVVGGQRQGEPFHDATWQPVPEIYSPDSPDKTPKWREVAPHSTPRAYHSWALLLPDATVVVGGGGLSSNQDTNHYDAQIYRPGYLFTGAAQPKIKTVDKKVYKVSEKIHITTDVEVNGASLIRYSAATHALNNDLRRIKLIPTPEGAVADKKYSMQIPDNAGIALPGYWMLFVLRNGVPSHAATVQILNSQPNALWTS